MSNSSRFLTCATCTETRRLKEEEPSAQWLKSLAPAKRVGALLTPLMQQWRINIDFRQPGLVRIEPDKVILLVPYATQKNRLSQIASRIESAIASAGIGLTAFEIHILPPESPEEPAPKTFEPRGHSTVGAADLALLAEQLPDGDFKLKAKALSDALVPETDTPDVLAAAQLDLVRGRYQAVRDRLFDAKTRLMVALTDAQAVDERFIYFPEQARESEKALEAHRVFEERLAATNALIDALRAPWETLERLRHEADPAVITKTLAGLPEADSFMPPDVNLTVRQHSATGAESLREVLGTVQSAKLHKTLEALAAAVDAPTDVKVEKLRLTLMERKLQVGVSPELAHEYERLLLRLGHSTRHYDEVLRQFNALEATRTIEVALPEKDPRPLSVAGAQALDVVLEGDASETLKAHFAALQKSLTPAHLNQLEWCLNRIQMRMREAGDVPGLSETARTDYLTELSRLRIELLSGTAVESIQAALKALDDQMEKTLVPNPVSVSTSALETREAAVAREETTRLERRQAFLAKLRDEADAEGEDRGVTASVPHTTAPRPYSSAGSALLEEASHETGMSEGLREKLARLAQVVKDGH